MNRYAKSVAALAAIAAVALSGCENAAQREVKYLQRGKVQVAAGDYEKARLEFQNALQIDPKNVDAQFQLAEVQEKLQNWRAAASGYQAVIEADPRHVGAETRLARLLLLAGQTDAAKKMIDEAAAVAPRDAGVHTIEGAVAAKRGDTAAALKEVQTALAADPGQLDGIMLLASLYEKQGKTQDAERTLQDAIKLYPQDVGLHLALADVYANAKDNDRAVDMLQDIVNLEPKSLADRARLAAYLVSMNRKDRAEQVLRRSVDDLPDDSRAKLTLADFLAKYHGRGDAEKALQGYIQQAPEDYVLRFGLAALYLSGGENDKAEGIYRGVIDSEGTGPKGLQARVLLARVLVKAGDAAGALSLLNAVLKENPTDNNALLLRGTIELAGGDPNSAVTDFRAVQKDQPGSVQVADMLARAQVAAGHPELARDQLQHAVDLQPQNDKLRLEYARLLAADAHTRDQALQQIQTVLKRVPKDLDALQLQFDVQMAAQDWRAAGATARTVKQAVPGAVQGGYMLGLADQGAKRYDAAAAEFQAVLDKTPDAAAPLSALVKNYLIQRRPKDALKAVATVLQRSPHNSVAYNLRGEVLLLQKDTAGAEQAFEHASRENPTWVVPYRNRAAAHLADKDVAAAIKTYQAGIAATHQAQPLVFDLAALYESQGRHDDAIEQYEAALKQAPRSPAAANNLAMMLVTYKTDPDSLARARRLVAGLGTSTNPAYLDTYGWVLYKNGDLGPAVDAFKRAVQAAPDAGLVRYHLGMALYTQGDKDGARENLQHALKDGGQFSGRDQAKAILKKLAS